MRPAKVDTEAERLGTKFGIRNAPTLPLFSARKIARQPGAVGQGIVHWVEARRGDL